jgi:hypothetical protein
MATFCQEQLGDMKEPVILGSCILCVKMIMGATHHYKPSF